MDSSGDALPARSERPGSELPIRISTFLSELALARASIRDRCQGLRGSRNRYAAEVTSLAQRLFVACSPAPSYFVREGAPYGGAVLPRQITNGPSPRWIGHALPSFLTGR